MHIFFHFHESIYKLALALFIYAFIWKWNEIFLTTTQFFCKEKKNSKRKKENGKSKEKDFQRNKRTHIPK